MSSAIKTTHMDGDLAVGRHVSMGGRANVAGSVSIGHNLKVEGWLDAPNIKGVNKGVFLTEEALRSAYPKPQEGWFAGVGSSTPFETYVVQNGEWVKSGGRMEINVEMNQYTEEVERLHERMDEAHAEIDDMRAEIAKVREEMDEAHADINKKMVKARETEEVGNLTFRSTRVVTLTESEFEEIGETGMFDENTLYLVVEEEETEDEETEGEGL